MNIKDFTYVKRCGCGSDSIRFYFCNGYVVECTTCHRESESSVNKFVALRDWNELNHFMPFIGEKR